MVNLEIGGVALALESGGQGVAQTYGTREVSSLVQLGDGRLFKQSLSSTVNKLTTRISGDQRWAAAALAALNYSQTLQVKCVAPRAIMESDTEIGIPAARRSDAGAEPFGFGVVDNRLVATPVTMVGDNANLDPVAGSDRYQVCYYPQITCYVVFTENTDTGRAYYSWVLDCREV